TPAQPAGVTGSARSECHARRWDGPPSISFWRWSTLTPRRSTPSSFPAARHRRRRSHPRRGDPPRQSAPAGRFHLHTRRRTDMDVLKRRRAITLVSGLGVGALALAGCSAGGGGAEASDTLTVWFPGTNAAE